jgi:hypothetical protein
MAQETDLIYLVYYEIGDYEYYEKVVIGVFTDYELAQIGLMTHLENMKDPEKAFIKTNICFGKDLELQNIDNYIIEAVIPNTINNMDSFHRVEYNA